MSPASSLLEGKNVLYVTLEMAEERIAERIDANLLDVTTDDLHALPKQMFDDRVQRLKERSPGKLIIKEYPTASAHSGHFKSLLNELALKKSFRPDVLFVDYLNICASSRFKGGNISSYFYIKAIAEELEVLLLNLSYQYLLLHKLQEVVLLVQILDLKILPRVLVYLQLLTLCLL